MTPRWLRRSSEVPKLARSRDQPEAFVAFYDELAPKVLRFFARSVRDVHVAFDLTAETFARAYENRGRFRGRTEAEAAGWLWAIARNTLAEYWRDASVSRSAMARLGLERPQVDDDELARIEELMAIDDSRMLVLAAVGDLPAEQREAVHLRVIEELSYEEIAQRLNVSNDVVRARASRGLRRLASRDDLQAMRDRDD